MDFYDLPDVIGEGGDTNLIKFYEQLKNNDFPVKKIDKYYYYQVDRWDLELSNNKIIKLPSNKINEAIQQSVELLANKDFEHYKVIDLRIVGKIIVE